LDGKTPDAVTYTGSEVGTGLSNDFLIENWDESDPDIVQGTETGYRANQKGFLTHERS
jgi:hypothetical protein